MNFKFVFLSNFEKLKYFVEKCIAYNQILMFEEKLCTPIVIVMFDTEQAQIKRVVVWGGGADHRVHAEWQ